MRGGEDLSHASEAEMWIAQAVRSAHETAGDHGRDRLVARIRMIDLKAEALIQANSRIAVEHRQCHEGASALACLCLRPLEEYATDALAARGGSDTNHLNVRLSWFRGVQTVLVRHWMDGKLHEAERNHWLVIANSHATHWQSLRMRRVKLAHATFIVGQVENAARVLAAKALVVHCRHGIHQFQSERLHGDDRSVTRHLIGRGNRWHRFIIDRVLQP